MTPQPFKPGDKDPTETVLIKHARYLAAYKAIQECLDSYGMVAQPTCKIITGPSGAGKSTIAVHFINEHPMKDGCLSVLRVTVPTEVTVRSFAEEVLSVLKDPYPSRGTAADLGRRIDRALGSEEGGHRVRVLLLDECQRFVDSRWTDLYQCANFIRERIEKSGSSFVLLGLDYSSNLLDSNEQLQRLFDETITIEPFSWSKADERAEFRLILKSLQQSLTGSYTFSANLADTDLSFRLHYASFGLIGYLMMIIRGAASLARASESKEISKALLEKSYLKHVRGKDAKHPNPFNVPGFDPSSAPAQELPKERAAQRRTAAHKRRKLAPRLSARTGAGM